ncbi:MAG: CPBP family intramembrane metalloprotease [Candidatus Korarchaeum sp.]|nr:CPBP family intramembrane metalloprotease [Candidatus Korarchaeum sp.]MDW8035761.1 CPBP family intramembrane glutamic endopeptidase [Candidatus Korarchaeum sp.]
MRGDLSSRGEGTQSTLSDAEFLIYLVLLTLIILAIPSIYLRAATSLLLLLILLQVKGVSYNLGNPRESFLSVLLAFSMTLPFLLFARVKYSGVSQLEIAQMVPWHISIAILEECLYRGPILSYSLPKFILSSSLFSLTHSQNPGFSILPSIGIFSAGIFLCSLRVKWGLLPSVLFHLSWNLCLEHLWGFPVSGLTGSSVFSLEPIGPSFLTGGEFGPEGSILAVAEFTLSSVLLNRRRAADLLQKAL